MKALWKHRGAALSASSYDTMKINCSVLENGMSFHSFFCNGFHFLSLMFMAFHSVVQHRPGVVRLLLILKSHGFETVLCKSLLGFLNEKVMMVGKLAMIADPTICCHGSGQVMF